MIVNIRYPSDAYERIVYPAGEKQIRLKPEIVRKVKATDQVRVWATIKDGDLTEVALLVNAMGRYTTLILPYFSYGRADRRFVAGDCCGAAVARDMLKSVADQVVTLDGHSPLAGVENVSPGPLIAGAIHEISKIADLDSLTLLLPDKGAKDRLELDNMSGFPVKCCTKKRDAKTGKLSGFKVPKIKTESVLIVDDICDGGGTFIGIADALKNQYKRLFLYVTHGIFSKGFKELNMRFDRIYCSDSFNIPQEHEAHVMACQPIIEEALR